MAEGMRINPTWAASLERQMRETRAALRGRDPAGVAARSGAACETLEGETRLEVHFWGHPYRISWPEVTVSGLEGEPCPLPVETALLQYLHLADGAPLEDAWVSLRNLPHGAFYEQAFQGYSGKPLAKSFDGDLDAFRAAAERIGGEPLEMGNAAYRFWAFPRVPVAVVYWSGGEEFPDDAQVLFDKSAGHYQPVEMLAHIGGTLCGRLVKARL
ncbi:MAG: DUF3786 domain-containing protein [Acidobacteria bacterium]|nr:DUF3786 domain-containing protein [Acidobacteriota bacterium]